MVWKDIEGYEGLYQISDEGEVRSLDRLATGNSKRMLRGKILSKLKTGICASTLYSAKRRNWL